MAGSGPQPSLSAGDPVVRPFRSFRAIDPALSAIAPNGARARELGGWTQVRNDHGPRNRSMADKPRYYLTTAIAYPNGPPHIGHAYEAIATDAIARFMRLDGYDVLFVTGTDEHGIKMLQTAAKEKLTPPQLVERNV